MRDYLETLDWDKQPPAPALPEEVVRRTSEKYLEAYQRLTRPRAWPFRLKESVETFLVYLAVERGSRIIINFPPSARWKPSACGSRKTRS